MDTYVHHNVRASCEEGKLSECKRQINMRCWQLPLSVTWIKIIHTRDTRWMKGRDCKHAGNF